MMSPLSSLFLAITVLLLLPILNAFWSGFDLINSGTSVVKINSVLNNGPPGLVNYSQFGSSVADIGDLDGDGIHDLVVGAQGEGIASTPSQGAVYILFMTASGAVKSSTRIGHLSNGGPLLVASDAFGASVCNAGDVNNDGINDIAVGAPGYVLGAVYLLFMKTDGTASSYRAIRGKFISKIVIATNYSNGPPLAYGSKFGSAVTSIGDFNKDGVPDIAVGELDSSNGDGKVYLLLLDRHATVLNYSTIGANYGGGPNIKYFSGFASSIQALADKDGDGNIEIAVGANSMGDTPESKIDSGAVFICFLNGHGTAKSCSIMGQLSEKKHTVPLQAEDACGSALGSIGDINLDNLRQHHWPLVKVPPRAGIEDLIMGCPQSNSGTSPGRIFLMFITTYGTQGAYTLFPAASNSLKYLAPLMGTLGLFGSSLSGFQDLNGDGIREIVVGAPGDDDGGKNSGAIYVLFLSRVAYYPGFHLPLYTLIAAFGSFFLFVLIVIFCWIFRRRKNIVEVSAETVGVEIEGVDEKGEVKKVKRKKRKIKANGLPELQYADEYDM